MLAASAGNTTNKNNNGNNGGNLECRNSKKNVGLKLASGGMVGLNGDHGKVSGAASTFHPHLIHNHLDDHDNDLGDLLSGENGKRRTDRSDSSESSDSGVATLSPSTSDSPELISPYSPCDLSSEPSDVSSFCGSGSSLGSSPSVSSSPPLLCDLGPDFDHHHRSVHSQPIPNATFTSNSNRMTAVASATLDTGPPPTHLNAVVSSKTKVPVTNFISFQIPQTQSHLQNSAFSSPLKILGDPSKTSNVQSNFNCDVRQFASASNIKTLIAALGYNDPKNGGGGEAIGNGTNGIEGSDRVGSSPFNGSNLVDFQSVSVPSTMRPSAPKSYILRGEGQRNGKVIILSVKPTALVPPLNSNGKNCTVVVPAIPTTFTTTTTSSTSSNKNKKSTSNANKPTNAVSPSVPQRKIPKKPETIPILNAPVISASPTSFPCQPLSCPTTTKCNSPSFGPSSKTHAPPVVLHFIGPKKTDDDVEVIKTSNSKLNLKKSNPPKRISLRTNNINHTLTPVLTSTTTMSSASSKLTTSCVSSTKQATTAMVESFVSKHDSEPPQECLTKLISISPRLTSCNQTNSNSFKPIDAQEESTSPFANLISAASTNNATNCSISSRKRKPASSLASSSTASSCSSPTSFCVPSILDRDSDLPDDLIISSRSSIIQVSIKSSSSTCSNESSESKTIASIFTSTSSVSIIASSPSSTNNNSDNVGKKSDRLLARSSASATSTEFCMWKDCECIPEANLNFLEHIQTDHVAPQTKPEGGYVCLWEGCKVYNKKSCSLSWLEHHVLTHGGNKPFRCIFAGCGLSFGTQGALERHVNSHILSNGNAANTNGQAVGKRLDSTPSKLRRKKQRIMRNAKVNTGHVVDFFDKRTMEVIKYRLCSAAEFEESVHNCTFKSQVLSRRTSSNQEPHLFVRWYPEFVLPDEWIPQSKYEPTKSVPFRQIPPDKIKILFPHMFPPERHEKAQRKWKPSTLGASAPNTNGNSLKSSHKDTCSCPGTGSDYCTSLNSDWAMFLAEQFLS